MKNIFDRLRTAEADLVCSISLNSRENYDRANDLVKDAQQEIILVITELEKLHSEFINEDESQQLNNDCFITASSSDSMTDPSGEGLMNDWAWKEQINDRPD